MTTAARRADAGARAWPWLVALHGTVLAVQSIELRGVPLVDRAVPTGAAIDAGEFWRPLTSLLVHPGGSMHLAINVALLLLIGPFAERELGPRDLLFTYFGIGYAANALRYAVSGRSGGGASAAIFAIGGAALSRRLAGRSQDTTVGWLALIGVSGGVGLAAAIGDIHVLAFGLGAACQWNASSSSPNRVSARQIAAIAAISTVALVVRTLRT